MRKSTCQISDLASRKSRSRPWGEPRHALFVAIAYTGLGDKQNALAQAKQAVTDYQNDAVVKPGIEIWLAKIQTRFGDFDSVLAVLPHLREVPNGLTRGDLRYSPFWDPLRGDPRFEQIALQVSDQQSGRQ